MKLPDNIDALRALADTLVAHPPKGWCVEDGGDVIRLRHRTTGRRYAFCEDMLNREEDTLPERGRRR